MPNCSLGQGITLERHSTTRDVRLSYIILNGLQHIVFKSFGIILNVEVFKCLNFYFNSLKKERRILIAIIAEDTIKKNHF